MSRLWILQSRHFPLLNNFSVLSELFSTWSIRRKINDFTPVNHVKDNYVVKKKTKNKEGLENADGNIINIYRKENIK